MYSQLFSDRISEIEMTVKGFRASKTDIIERLDQEDILYTISINPETEKVEYSFP